VCVCVCVRRPVIYTHGPDIAGQKHGCSVPRKAEAPPDTLPVDIGQGGELHATPQFHSRIASAFRCIGIPGTIDTVRDPPWQQFWQQFQKSLRDCEATLKELLKTIDEAALTRVEDDLVFHEVEELIRPTIQPYLKTINIAIQLMATFVNLVYACLSRVVLAKMDTICRRPFGF